MSINFAIYWNTGTNDYTDLRPNINSDDPNELYETGYRENKLSNNNSEFEFDPKYKEIHRIMFSDGPKLKFVPSDKFVGSLYGYVFYMGEKGLGYYIDPAVMRYVYQ